MSVRKQAENEAPKTRKATIVKIGESPAELLQCQFRQQDMQAEIQESQQAPFLLYDEQTTQIELEPLMMQNPLLTAECRDQQDTEIEIGADEITPLLNKRAIAGGVKSPLNVPTSPKEAIASPAAPTVLQATQKQQQQQPPPTPQQPIPPQKQPLQQEQKKPAGSIKRPSKKPSSLKDSGAGAISPAVPGCTQQPNQPKQPPPQPQVQRSPASPASPVPQQQEEAPTTPQAKVPAASTPSAPPTPQQQQPLKRSQSKRTIAGSIKRLFKGTSSKRGPKAPDSKRQQGQKGQNQASAAEPKASNSNRQKGQKEQKEVLAAGPKASDSRPQQGQKEQKETATPSPLPTSTAPAPLPQQSQQPPQPSTPTLPTPLTAPTTPQQQGQVSDMKTVFLQNAQHIQG